MLSVAAMTVDIETNFQSITLPLLRTPETNSNVILRRSRALARDRLEGWKQTPSLLPSFETAARFASDLLRMKPNLFHVRSG